MANALILIAGILLLAAGCTQSEAFEEEAIEIEMPNFSRNHPETIKGLLDPVDEHMNTLLNEELENVKALGINTIYVYVDYSYEDGNFTLTPMGRTKISEEKYINQIIEIKKKGFAVHVATAFGGGRNLRFNVPLAQFLEDAKQADLKWAAYAEKYKAESYSPSSEIDWQIFREYYGADWQNDTAHDEAAAISNRYHDDILPEIRSVFKGKIIYQAGLWNPNLGSPGYDLFGTGVNSVGSETEDFSERVKEIFRYAEANAKRQGSGWMVTELWIPVKENTGNPGTWP